MTATHQRIHRLLPIVLGMAVAFFIVAKPVAAHAAWLDIVVPFDALLSMILSMLVAVNDLLAQLLNASGGALKWVLSLEITTQLKVVGVAWTTIRDMANLVFIVIFIGISFGTIFNATGWVPGGWHYRTALMPLIIAAILMNFSLAIGKTVALASNQAAKVVLGVMGDPGAILIENMKPNTLAIGTSISNIAAALSAPIVDTIKTRTDAENIRYQKCLLEEKTVVDTDFIFISFGTQDYTVRKGIGDCNLEILAARLNTTPAEIARVGAMTQQERVAAAIPTLPINDKLMFIGNAIFSALMILLLISCLLSAFIFLALRIIMVWVLLATAALAWASYAIPGNNGFWHKWWTHMIAWNLFAPLYLLSLIPGLVMLGGSGEMMAQLARAGGTIGVSGMLIQQFFFYAFAVLIFVGGLALSLKSSFATTVAGSGVIGGWATRMGVFQEGNAKLGAIGRATGRATGVTAYGGAALDRAQQARQDITAAARGRFPALMRTEEEARALARARLGVRGGAAEFEKAISGRVKAERERVEEPLKQQVQVLENQLAQARTPEERKRLQDQVKELKDRNTQSLKTLTRSGNRDAALAAAEMLMEDDKLDADELRAVGQRYTQISPTAMAAFVKRRNEKLIKNVPKHKFKDAAELQSFMTLIGDPKDAKKYYDAAKGGRNKIMVLEAGANMKIEQKPDGTAYSFNELALKEAPKFKDEDWVAAEESFAQRAEAANDANPGGLPISSLDAMKEVGENFHDRFKRRFLNARQQENMRMAAGTTDQAVRLQKISDTLIKDEMEKKRLRRTIKEERDTAETAEKEFTEPEEKKGKEESQPREEGPKKTV